MWQVIPLTKDTIVSADSLDCAITLVEYCKCTSFNGLNSLHNWGVAFSGGESPTVDVIYNVVGI